MKQIDNRLSAFEKEMNLIHTELIRHIEIMHQELLQMINNKGTLTSIQMKEIEIQKLKAQIDELDRYLNKRKES